MSRRRARRSSPRPASGTPRRPSNDRIETRNGQEWNVRDLRGSSKTYRCPGCQHPLGPGTPHVLIWPVEKALLGDDPLDERRHWHTACWQREVPGSRR